MQIRVEMEQWDEVNRIGWAEAMEKFPKIEARQSLSMGADNFHDSYMELFTHVADIEVTDLEEAFLVHNNPYGNDKYETLITRYGTQHSMSVGDVLIGEYGDVHVVDGCGFVQQMSATAP